MNCINLLLVVWQSKGDNSVCIRLHKTQHLGKVHRARSQQMFFFQGLLLILMKAKMKFPAACQGKTRPVLCWAEVLSLCGWEIKFANFKKVSEFTWAMQAAERGCSGVWLISSRFYVCAGLLIFPHRPWRCSSPHSSLASPHMSVLILSPYALKWGVGSQSPPWGSRSPAWNYLQNSQTISEFPNLILAQGRRGNTPIIKTTLFVAFDQDKMPAFCLLHRKPGIGRSEEKALEQQGWW